MTTFWRSQSTSPVHACGMAPDILYSSDMQTGTGRVQFVISGYFIVLLLLGAGCLTGGFWLHTHQPPPAKPQTPPYYVNRISTAIRTCTQCVGRDGKIRERETWKFGKTIEIPNGETWWFIPVEDPPQSLKIDGVPMLAVHPASNSDNLPQQPRD